MGAPPEGWKPDPSWGPPPQGWDLWIDSQGEPLRDPDVIWEGKGQPVKGFGAGRYKLTRHYLFFEKGTLRTDVQLSGGLGQFGGGLKILVTVLPPSLRGGARCT